MRAHCGSGGGGGGSGGGGSTCGRDSETTALPATMATHAAAWVVTVNFSARAPGLLQTVPLSTHSGRPSLAAAIWRTTDAVTIDLC